MSIFGLGGKAKPREFTYVPQYYDEQKERLENMLKEADPNAEGGAEAMKARIKHGLSHRPYYYDKNNTASKIRKKSNMRVLLIIAALTIAALIYLGNNSETITNLAN